MKPHFPLVGLLAMLAGGCGSETPPPEAVRTPDVLVRTAPVERAAVAEPIRATGLLASKAEARLSFKIGGIVNRLYVDEGDRVRAGQTLATLAMTEIEAQVRQAQEAAAKAKRDLDRAERLFADSVVTLEQVQDARTGFEVAQQGVEIARFNWQYATIKAPFSGVVLKRFAEENELVSPGTPILRVAGGGQGWVVRVGLPDRDAVRIQPGDRATLTFDAFPHTRFAGRISEVAALATSSTGTYEVEVTLETTHPDFANGQVAKVELVPRTQTGLTLIPIEALIEGDGDQASVFTLDATGTKAVRVPIDVAFLTDDRVAVRRGLDSVQTVLTDGIAYVADGTPVKRVE
jgi:RND family efflux transporter MFP subunit